MIQTATDVKNEIDNNVVQLFQGDDLQGAEDVEQNGLGDLQDDLGQGEEDFDEFNADEDMGDEDSTESKIAKESATMNNRKIKDITENRPLTIFEKMTRELGSSIVRNVSIREQYLDENGSLDSGSVVESARVMYGFLETLNTLKLEKVDEKYIAKVLEEIR